MSRLLISRFLIGASALLAMTLAGPLVARAQGSAPIDVLFAAIGLPEIVEIMREEGVSYGAEMETDLFAGRGGARWLAMVDQIYDAEWMATTVRNRFDTELAAQDIVPMVAFFTSERGRRIIQLEVTARRALLDESVDEASRTALSAMILDRDPRLDLIREFAEANDLIESNVTGAMNASYAFYTGLAQGGAFPLEMTEDQILTDVWSQEEMIRDDTEEWLLSYLALAYRPLSDDDLRAYIAFSETEPGVAMNRALFVAFDEMFEALSLALGQAASRFLAGEEL